MADVYASLIQAIEDAERQFHRLVLLVGPFGSGKTPILRQLARDKGYAYVNVNLTLSQRMLELTRLQRARQVASLVQDLVAAQDSGVILLDNSEMLFDPALQVDPLRLLQSVSRNRTVVVAWNGSYRNETLTYAEPNHPEYREFKDLGAITVLMEPATATHSG